MTWVWGCPSANSVVKAAKFRPVAHVPLGTVVGWSGPIEHDEDGDVSATDVVEDGVADRFLLDRATWDILVERAWSDFPY